MVARESKSSGNSRGVVVGSWYYYSGGLGVINSVAFDSWQVVVTCFM